MKSMIEKLGKHLRKEYQIAEAQGSEPMKARLLEVAREQGIPEEQVKGGEA